MTTDVVVIGGGPVGLITALYARRSGLSVVVLEPRSGPVDKACGEGLMPAAVRALAGLGVRPSGCEFKGIRYVDGARQAVADFSGGPGLGARRTVLHAALLAAADRDGMELVTGSASSVTQDAVGVRVETATGRGATGPIVAARYAVAADGLHSPTRTRLGLDRPTRARRRYGLRRHFVLAPWSDRVEVYWGRDAELYVTPVGPELVGVAVLSSDSRTYEELLSGFPEIAGRLASAPAASSIKGAAPLRQRSIRRVEGRVLLAGDASGYVDALTGEGLSVGFEQARCAVEAIGTADPAAYEHGWHRVTRRSSLLTLGLLAATRPSAGRRLIVPAAAAFPGVFRRVVDALGNPAGGSSLDDGPAARVAGSAATKEPR